MVTDFDPVFQHLAAARDALGRMRLQAVEGPPATVQSGRAVGETFEEGDWPVVVDSREA